MKKIIYTCPDGGVSVCTPAEGCRLASSVTIDGRKLQSKSPLPVDQFLRRWPVDGAVAEWAETESEWLARIAAKDVPKDATNVQIVDESAIPTDRAFRNAWKAGNKCVEHDLPKCKAIAHDKRREKRAAEFAPLDDLIAKKIPGTKESEVEAERQKIREKYDAVQAAIDAAQTVEEIKSALI